jgi:predicted esterase
MRHTGLLALRSISVLALGACSSSSSPPATTGLFALPDDDGGDFYALPFPNDLRRHDDGTLDLSAFPSNSLLMNGYRDAAATLDGFGFNAPGFVEFDGPLDPASLPDPAASTDGAAAVYLVNVDADSPEFRARTPVIVTFYEGHTQTIGDNHLVVRPFPGFPLLDGTTYAIVVTTRVRDAAGAAIAPGETFTALVGTAAGTAALDPARDGYDPLLALLDEPGGDERADVATAAVFTTQRAVSVAPALRRGVLAAPQPIATVLATTPSAEMTLFLGEFTGANFQRGAVPYLTAPEGQIEIDATGTAVVQRLETIQFALSVPPGPTPPGGWPIAIFQHGTGGNRTSFVRNGTAVALAAQGIAVLSSDQVLHGPRNPGGDPEVDFYNFANPYAMRDNPLQGAADAWSLLRLAQGLAIVDGERTITVDPTKVFFFGHSQGGATGPAFVAFEPTVSGAVLSGAAGLISLALLYKTEPVDIPPLTQTFLRDNPMDEDNPSLALCQMWLERSDAINYARFMARAPALDPRDPDGVMAMAPRNIFQGEGFTDRFSPNPGIEAFATAIGGDLLATPDQQDIRGLTELRQRTVREAPFDTNVGGATVVVAQYAEVPDSDGHFVLFERPEAQRLTSEFLGSLARTGTATIVGAP